jgi:gas vesicle protein
MESGKFVLGILAGVAIGATLGILFAPEKGSVTMHKISQKSGDYADELGEKFHEFMNNIGDKYNEMKHEASKAAEQGKDKAKELANGAIAAAKQNSPAHS